MSIQGLFESSPMITITYLSISAIKYDWNEHFHNNNYITRAYEPGITHLRYTKMGKTSLGVRQCQPSQGHTT